MKWINNNRQQQISTTIVIIIAAQLKVKVEATCYSACMRQPHHKSTQVWQTSEDHTVLPATYEFIN